MRNNNVSYDASLDEKMEERNQVDIIRDDSDKIKVGDIELGKIRKYKYKVYVHEKPTLEGELSREEMNLIYSLYSSEGANLQQRQVVRSFPNFTLQDLKRILRAFNITKASPPFAPHIIEENTNEKLVELTLINKENSFLKRLEQDRGKETEKHLKELSIKYHDLKSNLSDFIEVLPTIKVNIPRIGTSPRSLSTNSYIVVYLSDMHIGAAVSEDSIYDNVYNAAEVRRRLTAIAKHAIFTASKLHINNIVVCNLGDSLDGMDNMTARRTHVLPQNMDNKDQFKNYVTLMTEFFAALSGSNTFNRIYYYSVDSGNHDGDFGFVTNKALEAVLNILNPNITVKIFSKFIDSFMVADHTFLLCHGKDAKDMSRGFPLLLNDKVENQINEFLDYSGIYDEHIHFVKGDLHQSATTYGKRFRYKSTSSFFGSSEWVHKNFGNTKAAVDYDIILEDGSLLEGQLKLN